MRRYLLITVGIAALVTLSLLALASRSHAAESSAVVPMPDDERVAWFWGIIERTGSPVGDQDQQVAALEAELSKLSAAEIEAFGAVFDGLLTESYSWDLWGAAYVIMGGASDDSFDYFRAWLISRGRDVYEAARANPDALAGLIPAGFGDIPEFEGLAYVDSDVWQEKAGGGSAIMPSQPDAARANEPSGEPFDESPEDLAQRYPRLWARFSESPLG